MVGMHLADDLGIWENYGQLQRDFQAALLQRSDKRQSWLQHEFKSYSWDKYEKGDPTFLFDLLPRIAEKRGELATALGLGTGYLLERWGIPEKEWLQDQSLPTGSMGIPNIIPTKTPDNAE